MSLKCPGSRVPPLTEGKVGLKLVHPVGQPDWADIVELGNSLLPVT